MSGAPWRLLVRLPVDPALGLPLLEHPGFPHHQHHRFPHRQKPIGSSSSRFDGWGGVLNLYSPRARTLSGQVRLRDQDEGGIKGKSGVQTGVRIGFCCIIYYAKSISYSVLSNPIIAPLHHLKASKDNHLGVFFIGKGNLSHDTLLGATNSVNTTLAGMFVPMVSASPAALRA